MSSETIPVKTVTGKIAFATVVRPPELFTTDQEALSLALVVGTKVERHNRVWRMGRVVDLGHSFAGRIGFESSGGKADVWNEKTNDFEEIDLPNGTTSPFAVRKSDLRVAFQLRGNTIRRQTFAGAFQALLRVATPGTMWRVIFDEAAVGFRDWATTVDRVTSIRFHLEEPNPHFGERHLVRQLVEGTGSVMSNVVLRADDDQLDGITVDSAFVAQAVQHVELNYGSVRATGERTVDGETETVRWDGGQEIEDRTVGVDPETGEVNQETLGLELTAEAAGAEASHDEQDWTADDSYDA